jgi:hypothetical protein
VNRRGIEGVRRDALPRPALPARSAWWFRGAASAGAFSTSNPDAPGVFLGGVTDLQGASTHSSEKGSEYELEFEDEYDSGTIGFLLVRDLLASIDWSSWSSSDDRAVCIPVYLAPRRSSNRFRSGIVLVLELALVLASLPPYYLSEI